MGRTGVMRTKLPSRWDGFLVAALLGMSHTWSAAAGQETQGPPQARGIPGITAEDSYPNGCVDCHLNYTEMNRDTRLSTLMKQWTETVEPRLLQIAQASAPKGVTLKGRHPEQPGALEEIPAKCIACHEKKPKLSPPFAEMIHSIHLAGGQDNHFLTVFQGECTHCHKLEVSTGRWTMPSANEK